MPRTSAPTGHAQFLSCSDGPIYTVLHHPGPQLPVQSTAVLLVPPFGWDEYLSHRDRRYWAIKLANAGFPTLRIDLPGTAQSHGDAHASDLTGQWSRAVGEAGRWLLASTGASRLAAIAIGIGGLVTLRAVAEGAPIDDLVLWAVKGRGRSAVRELKAYAGMVASEHPEDSAGPAPSDGIDVTGYLLAHTTMADLSAIDVAALSFPAPERRRALLLNRDELGVDEYLRSALADAGIPVTSVKVNDYGRLMAHPQDIGARRPDATISLVSGWLDDGVGGDTADASGAGDPGVAAGECAWVPYGSGQVHETILNLSLGGEPAVVVITSPDDTVTPAPLSALLLNSGTLNKDGPHRIWVELARRWASRGIVTVRADFGSIGDSGGVGDRGGDERPAVLPHALSSPTMIDTTQELIGTLRARGIVDRLVLVGHCSGAYLGFHSALETDGIAAVFSVNQPAFRISPELFQERMFERIVTVARGGIVKRLREQGLAVNEVRQVMEAVRHRYRPGRTESAEGDQGRAAWRLLDRLRDRDVKVLMLIALEGTLDREVFGPEFQAELALDRWPNTAIEELPTRDHMVRAIWLQKLTQARLDLEMDSVLSSSLSVTK